MTVRGDPLHEAVRLVIVSRDMEKRFARQYSDGERSGAEARAATAVGLAVAAGATVVDIARASRISELDLMVYVEDQDLRCEVLRGLRKRALMEAERVLSVERVEALWMMDAGMMRSVVARSLGVTRPTLDKWIRDAEEEAEAASAAELEAAAV